MKKALAATPNPEYSKDVAVRPMSVVMCRQAMIRPIAIVGFACWEALLVWSDYDISVENEEAATFTRPAMTSGSSCTSA